MSDNGFIDKKLIKEFWKKKANDASSRWTSSEMLDFEVSKVLSHKPSGDGLQILDLGCGDGSLSKAVLGKNDYLLAIDYVESFARHFRNDMRVTFRRQDINKFSSRLKFDLILFFGVITHLNPKEEFDTLSKIAKNLKTQGKAIVKLQCSDNESFVFNGFSDDLGTKYSARYPSVSATFEGLSRHFRNIEVVRYPDQFKRFSDSSHYMFVCDLGPSV